MSPSVLSAPRPNTKSLQIPQEEQDMPISATIEGENSKNLFHKTMQNVSSIAKVRVGDVVLTQYGQGKVLSLGNGGEDDDSTKIALGFGILCTRTPHNIHRRLPEQEFQEAMNHLDELRKSQLAAQCKKWNVTPCDDSCASCLLERPEFKKKRQERQSKWNRLKENVNRNKKPQTNPCDVCGNPVCAIHDRIDTTKGEYFHMCVDCAFDLNQVEHQLNAYHPQVLNNLERLLHLYTRMCLQFSFWLPYVPELCNQIFAKQRKNAKISLGTTGLGFVGAALGVAGAATLLTPAGPAVLIAAMSTSATSGVLQATHQGYDKFFSSKDTFQNADRMIGWHGLCCGILASLEQLRQDLLAEKMIHNMPMSKLNLTNKQKAKNDGKSAEIWNTLAVGSMGLSRSAFTGVGVTASMGASYAQVMQTSLQTVPVVGAAFSVTYMAMDAGNIYNHLQQLSTPNSYIVKLKQLELSQTNFQLPHINTIDSEVRLLEEAIKDLNNKLDQLREEQDLEYNNQK